MDKDKPIVPRSKEKTKKMQNRLRRIEGQVRGIEQMITSERYCTDILVQISAVNAALKKVGLEVLEHHIGNCVVKAAASDKEDRVMEDLMHAIRQFSKT